jgi:hypothetical protein
MLSQILTLIRTKQRDMNPYPVFVLLPSFTTNILAKFVVNFVPNEGRRTKTGYRHIVPCLAVFFWVRARIRVSIHKQRHIGRHVEQPPVTSNSVCARQCADGKNWQAHLRLRTSLSCSNSLLSRVCNRL